MEWVRSLNPLVVDGLMAVFFAIAGVATVFTQEIKDGRLYQPFDIEIDTESAYWLAFPEGRRNVPKIKAFRDWILAEIGRPD